VRRLLLLLAVLLLPVGCGSAPREPSAPAGTARTTAGGPRDAGTTAKDAQSPRRGSFHRRGSFNGDYQSGTFDQWPGKNLPDGAAEIGERIAPVPPPPGYPKVARFTLGLGGPRDRRTEVLRHPTSDDGVPGVETWWRWYILFPDRFRAAPNGDLIVSDWHNTVSGCAPLAIFDALSGPRLVLRIRSGPTRIQRWGNVTAPPVDRGFEGRTYSGGHQACETQVDRTYAIIPRIKRNHWYQIVVHVKWTSIPRAGYFDVWVDGCRRTPGLGSPRRRIATLMNRAWGQAYFKQGIYDPHGWPPGTPTSTVFYTGTRQFRSGEHLVRGGCRGGALRGR
jgi:Polysaccharide lyase